MGKAPVGRIDELRFTDVSFRYRRGDPVLRDVSFSVHRGEVVGIVGPSGSGKSTLAELILRTRKPSAGCIEADGRDVRGLSLGEWQRRTALVPQDARLLAGSVSDNIRFSRKGLAEDMVERAARRAHVHEEIVRLPLGYETAVDERGGGLSRGQRQRLFMARALVDDPDVLVVDEPTIALDPRSEKFMRDAICGLQRRTTVFVIAHRMSTLTICDRIMVMLQGELQDFDAPPRLARNSAPYREAFEQSSWLDDPREEGDDDDPGPASGTREPRRPRPSGPSTAESRQPGSA